MARPMQAPLLRVEPLFRCPASIPTVRAWLLAQWPTWYGEGGPGDLAGDVEGFARSPESLPAGFLVFQGLEPVGFAALKAASIPSHRHLSPWAAAGFVLPQHRRRGVGAFLLQSLVAQARRMGYGHVFCGTGTAATLLQRSGWQLVERVMHAGQPLGVFCIETGLVDGGLPPGPVPGAQTWLSPDGSTPSR